MPNWPSGFHGDLVVFSGETRVIEADSIWDFRTILIENGAVLEIARGAAWTSIGCVGGLIVNGTIRSTKSDYVDVGGKVALDGYQLFAAPSARAGGNGGNTWNRGDTYGGNAQAGNGGGGAASATNGGNASVVSAGHGATRMPPANKWRCARGGAGGTLDSVDGKPGGDIVDNIEGGGAIGGGGGGGARGFHGGLLYLRVLGDVHFQNGLLDFAGSKGGIGGRGGNAVVPDRNDLRAGGGGGGGAGGNGGHVILRYGGNLRSGIVNVSEGRGGNGGHPGTCSRKTIDPQPQGGGQGEDGAVGSFQAIAVPNILSAHSTEPV